MNLEVIDAVIFIAGAAVGLFLGMSLKKENKSATNNTTILSPDAVKHELDKQQVAIDSFFEETENALEQAETTVAKLRNQIANGALELSNVNIQNNSDINTTAKIEDTPKIEAEPPRDYALKTDVQSPGTLSEDFGFNKEQEKSNTP
ncbi:DUF1043 family protein [Marinomonas sp. S3726]|jgi:uncharacterized membrane-anchored protein YhcB (DUF1043 family)|uniref:ZapG family protein n=1 Tax=Marinomonas sp. S3726 TaxID=579484 RepID=UPI0005FA4E2B|nr:DUF1043 family protein [Marinomonas sp. S3726]